MSDDVRPGRVRRAAQEALVGAALFGASAPVAKRLLADVPPLALAALLYTGAGLVLALAGTVQRRRVAAAHREAPLRRADGLLLASIGLFGGVVGPLLMLLSLPRLSGLTASLLLNLEAPFTALLAVACFGEHLGRAEVVGTAIVIAAASALGLPGGTLGGGWAGVLGMGGACLAWALDNNLTQRLSVRDPVVVARVKGLAAGAINAGLAWWAGAAMPPIGTAVAGLSLGAASYGVSLVLSVRAMRTLGAARQAAYFATAPFAGALIAVAVFADRPTLPDLGAAAAMAAGVAVLVRAAHDHEHTHDALEHEHLHEHDLHHRHDHAGVVPGPHSHLHVHEAVTHRHAHVSDAHHRHRH